MPLAYGLSPIAYDILVHPLHSQVREVPVPEQSGCGTGHLRSGQRDLGLAHYEIHVGLTNTPGTIVELESPPVAQNGEILELSLEDGRVLLLQVRDVSPYCRVIGERAQSTRRTAEKDTTVPSDVDQGRRRSDWHGWGEPPSVVAAATKTDRRALERADDSDRRAGDRVRAPTCAYCATDAYVRSTRRTSDEVYFVCGGCKAMWVFPRPRSGHRPHSVAESR